MLQQKDTQPAWIARVLAYIRAEHRLARVAFAPAAPKPREPLLARAFHRLDEKRYGRAPNGLTPTNVAPLIADVGTTGDVDVIIAFVPFHTEDAEVWTIERDGLWEFVSRQPMLHATLQSRGKIIASTSAKPDAISFHRAMARLGFRIAAMIEHQLDRRARGSVTPVAAAEPRMGHDVTNAQIVASAASSVRGWIHQQVRDRYIDWQWTIAFSFGGKLDFKNFHRVTPPRDRMWADPFVVADGERAWIFVEEMLFAEGRGFIAVIEVRRDGTFSAARRVLERPYHLSYPCVFPWNGTYFMLPETHENRTIELYRCVEFPHRWEPDDVLFRDLAAVDATIFEAHGRWWLYFATGSGDGEGFDRLWLHHAPAPRGPWTPHAWNPLECNVAGGRPGGRPFVRRDADGIRMLRATQIGAPWYGHAIRLREMVTLTPDEWLERDVETITPDWLPRSIATHTLNIDGEVAVIDGALERLRR